MGAGGAGGRAGQTDKPTLDTYHVNRLLLRENVVGIRQSGPQSESTRILVNFGLWTIHEH